jgi:lycopene beta-cyclase
VKVVERAPFDLILAGGGLAAGLCALAFARHRPAVRVAIVERGLAIGGNHIWSCFDTDLDAAGQELVDPVTAGRWPGYDVRFPGLSRRFAAGYRSLTSARLDAAVRAAVPEDRLLCGVEIVGLEPGAVHLGDGRTIRGAAVLDARGARAIPGLDLGYQNFIGLEVELARPHDLELPVIMDATVAQTGAYRFVYVLPFSPTRLLVEDTYYADHPALDRAAVVQRIHAYAAAQGWHVATVLRREEGMLPIPMGGDIGRHLSADSAVAPIGMAAALCHPLTGYSLPDAVRLALDLAGLPDLAAAALDHHVRGHVLRLWRQRRYYRLLARMLFRAAAPDQRWRVLQHFYALDPDLVARFFAGHSSIADRVRILAGRPPVPVGRALAVLLGGKGMAA